VVYSRRPELVDELQRIRGVGPMLEQELHRLGVFRFKQIASWTLTHIKEFGLRLNCFPDRMERDQWVEQAKALHAEAVTIAIPLGTSPIRPNSPMSR